METMENVVLREQKVRFLASEILLKGAAQTIEDVCRNCRLFSVTPNELRELASTPINFGKRCAKVLIESNSGDSMYVTKEFKEEIGHKSVVVPFKNEGEKWPRGMPHSAPGLPDFEKSITTSKLVIHEYTRCDLPESEGARAVLSTPPVAESHVWQSPSSGEVTRTHAGTAGWKLCAQSTASQSPINRGSTPCEARKEGNSFPPASTPHGSAKFSKCPSNCESASSQEPTEQGVQHQGDRLRDQGLLRGDKNGISSTSRVKKAIEVPTAVSLLAGGKDSAPRRGRKSKVSVKLELRTQAPKVEVEGGTPHKYGLSSRLTRSATASLPKNGVKTPEKNRDGGPCDNVGNKKTPESRKRRRMKGLDLPVAVKEERIEGGLHNLAQPDIHAVSRLELGSGEHSEAAGETRICVSGTDKLGIADLDIRIQANAPTPGEAGLLLKPRKKRKTVGVSDDWNKDVTVRSSLVVSLTTPGLTNCQHVNGPVSVRGPVHVDTTGDRRVSPFTSEELVGVELDPHRDAVISDEVCGGNFNHRLSCSDFYGGMDAGTLCGDENLTTLDKDTDPQRIPSLYLSGSDEDSSAAKLPFADVKVHRPLVLHRNPDDAISLNSNMVQQHAVNSAEIERAPETGVDLVTSITGGLRKMNTMMVASIAEHVEVACTTGLSSSGGETLQCTVPEVEICASLPCCEFRGGAPLDKSVEDVNGSEYSFAASTKQSKGQMEHGEVSHASKDPECLHHDVDDCAAFPSDSFLKLGYVQAECNNGEVAVMCVQPGDETMDGILNPFHHDDLQHGASCNAKRRKDGEDDTVCGEESRTTSHFRHMSLGKTPIVRERCAAFPCRCQVPALEQDLLSLTSCTTVSTVVQRAPTVEAKQFLADTHEKASCTVGLVESTAVSPSNLSSKCGHVGDHSITADCPFRQAVTDKELKGQSRIEARPVVPALQKEGKSSYAATARLSQATDARAWPEEIGVSAKPKHVRSDGKEGSLAFKGKVRFERMEPAQSGFGGVTNLKHRLGDLSSRHIEISKGMETSPAGDVGNEQVDLAAIPRQEVLRDKVIKGLHPKRKCCPGDKLATSKPLTGVIMHGTKDRSPGREQKGNQPGTSQGANVREPIPRERLKVPSTVIPENVKIIEPVQKQKNHESKSVPEFENYTVIGEEGCGGYGTVYKVMNNDTERIYAMKCPLLKTSSSCVENEISMLQQLGGKECIIKFERVVRGSFRTLSESGEKLSECKSILLEFMEHDKPEVLKKEITVEELKDYSVCLFRALAHMHGLRIMHLDIKPGNFLFSRSKKRGFLVDFNLARYEEKQPKRMKTLLTKDLVKAGKEQIVRIDASRSSKRPLAQATTSTPINYSKRSRLLMGASGTQLSYGTPSPVKTLKDQSIKSVGHGVSADMRVSSPTLPDLAPSRSTTPMGAFSSPRRTAESPKPAIELCDLGARQSCEGSADVLKNHTIGFRSQYGHRALLNYIQTKVYNQQPPVFNQQQSSLPAPQRKRVAAVQNKKKNAAAGNVPVTHHASQQPSTARRLKTSAKLKGYKDQRKDGLCVGTKGYRAPEVLLKSLEQTTKVDIWSAGVSLLHLISGRSPFSSTSPEGALKDIAKVRGSDAILALAMRHERQHCISKELRAIKYPPVTIREWCEKHSKRPDLKGKIPPELFDLLEKCLDVDPLSRITAEEALKHQFCSPVS